MRPTCWLHISDIHLRSATTWSQDIVLTAMCKQIKEQREHGTIADFILLTGDIAFAGKSEEYDLAADFLDALCAASNVPKERVFCVPGNHDIDRDRQLLCFRGGRATLTDASQVDTVLEGGEDLESLLKREENYRHFQKEYFTGQKRVSTDDGLGYVTWLTIEDVRFAIIGLDSAWLAYGGNDDLGKLLVGERQVIGAINLVKQDNEAAHVVIAMTHHPLHFLQDFDRRTVMNQIEDFCHFLHYGHLHEPESRTTGKQGSGCLNLAAGASFQTRQYHNSYSVVRLDLLSAVRSVETFQYRPSHGSFSSQYSEDYRIEVMLTEICDVAELAQAMSAYDSRMAGHSYYLSSLILKHKTDLVTPVELGYSFASYSVLQELPSSELKERTEAFLKFQNVLHVLYQKVSLSEIFNQHGELVAEYDTILRRLCKEDRTLRTRIDLLERDAQVLAATSAKTPFSHSTALLTELAAEQDWVQLQNLAQRHMESHDPHMRTLATRMMARSLASSDEITDDEAAIELYRSITDTEFAEHSDAGNLSILLAKSGNYDEARKMVLKGIDQFPSRKEYFFEIGQMIVGETGDKEFRQQIETALVESNESE